MSFLVRFDCKLARAIWTSILLLLMSSNVVMFEAEECRQTFLLIESHDTCMTISASLDGAKKFAFAFILQLVFRCIRNRLALELIAFYSKKNMFKLL